MGRYHATVESRHSATETSGHLATFSDAAEWDPECSPGSSWIPARPALAAASGSAWPSGPGCGHVVAGFGRYWARPGSCET
jgi:hypothetical protein